MNRSIFLVVYVLQAQKESFELEIRCYEKPKVYPSWCLIPTADNILSLNVFVFK